MSRRPSAESFDLSSAKTLGVVIPEGAGKTPKGKRAAIAPHVSFGLLSPGPPGSWTVTLPGWHPPSLNALMRMNRFKASRLCHGIDARVALECLAAGVATARGRRRVAVVLVAPNRRHRKDRDNVLKTLLDALTTCGALVDDGADHLEPVSVEYEVGAKGTRLMIEDVG